MAELAGRADMRLDKFLWFARLAKTRAIAQAIVGSGHLRIDGRRVDRAHTAVRHGMVLSMALHDRVRVIRIEALPPRRGPAAEARACYADLSPPPPASAMLTPPGSRPSRAAIPLEPPSP